MTREASDMVLADDNFASIVAAVREGRGIFDNIRKTLVYLLAGNTAELLVMLVAGVAGKQVDERLPECCRRCRGPRADRPRRCSRSCHPAAPYLATSRVTSVPRPAHRDSDVGFAQGGERRSRHRRSSRRRAARLQLRGRC